MDTTTQTTNSNSNSQAEDSQVESYKIEAFASLQTNVKGYTRSYDIAPCTAFVGENRVGKTAALDSVRLALTGAHPGLSELGGVGQTQLSATLTGKTGMATFSTAVSEKGKAKQSASVWTGAIALVEETLRENVLPTVSLRELLSFGGAKTREAIFRRFGNVTDVPVPKGLGAGQTELWISAVKDIANNGTTNPADILAEVRSWMDGLKRRKSKEMKSLKEQITYLETQNEQAGGGTELLPELENQLRAAERWETLSSTRSLLESKKARLEQIKMEAKALKEIDETLAKKQATVEAKRNEFNARTVPALDENSSAAAAFHRVEDLLHMAQKLSAGGAQSCPLCHTDTPNYAKAVTHLQNELQVREEVARKAQAARDELQRAYQSAQSEVLNLEHAYRNEVQTHEIRKDRLRGEITSLLESIAELEKVVTEAGGAYAGPPSAEIRLKIESLKQLEARVRQTVEQKKLLEMAEATHVTAQKLEKEAKALLTEMLKSISDAATGAVNKYMPEGFRAELVIDGATCEWRIVGQDNRAHAKTMAGSEKAALTLAVALAWSEGLPLRIVCLDDEDITGFSPKNIQSLLTLIHEHVAKGSITQAFLATSRPHELPATWKQLVV